jgi:hypothetical protein
MVILSVCTATAMPRLKRGMLTCGDGNTELLGREVTVSQYAHEKNKRSSTHLKIEVITA